jgi:hypothetical protein
MANPVICPGTPLDALGLKPHTRVILEANWYRTIEQVLHMSEYHMRNYCPGIGPVRSREIFRAVERYRASFNRLSFSHRSFLSYSHVLRHSCSYKLANDGRDTRSIRHCGHFG